MNSDNEKINNRLNELENTCLKYFLKIRDLEEEVYNLKKSSNNTTVEKNEAYYQKILVEKGFGNHEVVTLGITDITGPNIHIEIKNWKEWIKASGQLDAYNFCSPKTFQAIYFFGEPPTTKKLVEIIKFLESKYIRMFSFHTIDDSITEHWAADCQMLDFLQQTMKENRISKRLRAVNRN